MHSRWFCASKATFRNISMKCNMIININMIMAFLLIMVHEIINNKTLNNYYILYYNILSNLGRILINLGVLLQTYKYWYTIFVQTVYLIILNYINFTKISIWTNNILLKRLDNSMYFVYEYKYLLYWNYSCIYQLKPK